MVQKSKGTKHKVRCPGKHKSAGGKSKGMKRKVSCSIKRKAPCKKSNIARSV